MTRTARYSDDDIFAAMRAAAGQCGEPLSHNRYDGVTQDGPSAARIIQRFGSWSKACAAAGLTSAAPSRSYSHRWNHQNVSAAVAEYLRSGDGTYAGYEAWARSAPDRPSGATVRNMLGGWAAAKRAAGA